MASSSSTEVHISDSTAVTRMIRNLTDLFHNSPEAVSQPRTRPRKRAAEKRRQFEDNVTLLPTFEPVQTSQRTLGIEGAKCSMCNSGGPAVVANCGCAYHRACLSQYAKEKNVLPGNLCCAAHHAPLGALFVLQAVPDFKVKRCLPPSGGRSRFTRESVAVLPCKPEKAKASLSTVLSIPRPRAAIRSASMPAIAKLCVICSGVDQTLKPLQCGCNVHKECIRKWWFERCAAMGCTTGLPCPSESSSCCQQLEQFDLLGVVDTADIEEVEQEIKRVQRETQQLIHELQQQEHHTPTFHCAICLVEHDVDGCCTLPCQHRFCFESLQCHFDVIVRERRLDKLVCPAEGCGASLRSAEAIHIFAHCLSGPTYHKLLDFLARDDPHVHDCKIAGCEERVFVDDEDDIHDICCGKGHRFCGQCQLGPHHGLSCDARKQQKEQERQQTLQEGEAMAWRAALAAGWRPCPRNCSYGGGYKDDNECDHVTCPCGFEFCWDCGVDRRVLLLHDNRWHKPACRYHTPHAEVTEAAVHVANCPACRLAGDGIPCPFLVDDGYPEQRLPQGVRHAQSQVDGNVAAEADDPNSRATGAWWNLDVMLGWWNQ